MSSFCSAWIVHFIQNNRLLDCIVTPYTWRRRFQYASRVFLRKMERIRGDKALASPIPQAREIVNVLLFCCWPGFGDALYVNGLSKYLLSTSRIKVHIVASPKLKSIFRTTLPEDAFFDISNEMECKRVARCAWDVVVDLTYHVLRDMQGRVQFLGETNSPVLGTDPFIRQRWDICSEWVDISKCVHIGDRMSKVAERLVGHQVKRIIPYAGFPRLKGRGQYVYVNCVGTRQSRSLSQSQIDWIADFFTQKHITAYFYLNKYQALKESEYVSVVKPESFSRACQWIGGATGVLSPDTSSVHVASAYGIPQLCFFAGNVFDGFGYPMEEVWGPLSVSEVLKPSRTPFFSKGVVPVSEITQEEITEALLRFISRGKFIEN